MPPGKAGSLPDEDFAALAAMILQENGAGAPARLSGSAEQLAGLNLPGEVPITEGVGEAGIGGISRRHPMPPVPSRVDCFAGYVPVTQAMLSDPAPENWLSWRRGHNGASFSPLTQITPGSVGTLRLVWAQGLPARETTANRLCATTCSTSSGMATG